MAKIIFECPCGKKFTLEDFGSGANQFFAAQNHMYYCEKAHEKLRIKESDPYTVKVQAINKELERQTLEQLEAGVDNEVA